MLPCLPWRFTTPPTGTIPGDWNSLQKLQVLDLSWNRLQFDPPAAYSGLAAIKTLALRSNTLVGTIPASWASISDTLTSLVVANNSGLTGCWPNAALLGLANAAPGGRTNTGLTNTVC
jgi:hypothetical protein